MTTDDRTLELAIGRPRDDRPRHPRPRRPRGGRPGRPLRPDGLAHRTADRGLERHRRLGRRVGPSTTRRSRRQHTARTGRPAYPAAGCRPSWRRPSSADSAATGVSASTSTCGATPTSSATSGPRPSRSRAAKSGRTAGSRRRSVARRRSEPSARPSVTTRSRSSCRAIGSSGRTGRSASTRSAVPANKRAILPAEGPRSRRARGPWPGRGSATSARTRPTSCACRRATTPGGSRRRTGCRSGRWPARGRRRVPGRAWSCRPDSGAGLAAA